MQNIQKQQNLFLNNTLDLNNMVLGYVLTLPDIKCDMFTGMQLKDYSKFSNIYDLNILNSNFKMKTKKHNISCTYDGFVIVSEKFKQFCEIEEYSGLEFVSLSNSTSFYWFKIKNVLEYDAKARGTRFLNYSSSCNGYEEIIGATPVCLKDKALLPKGFFRTDIFFGSFAGKSPLYLVGEITKKKLLAADFQEIYFEKILDEY